MNSQQSCLILLILVACATGAIGSQRTCAETFQSPGFQALNIREARGVDFYLKALSPLKGQACTVEQVEVFFNGKGATTFNRSSEIVSFDTSIETGSILRRRMMRIWVVIENGGITDIAVATEGL